MSATFDPHASEKLAKEKKYAEYIAWALENGVIMDKVGSHCLIE
jgi:hypothetical protein